MPDFLEPIAGLDPEERWKRALDLSEIVAPYGVLASEVVDPALFVALQSRLGGDAASTVDADAVRNDCESVIDRFADEPGGAGFFAFGAVVALYYACGAMQGEPEAAVHCAKRFLDLLGAADDDGVSGLFDAAVRYLAAPTPEGRRIVVERVRTHADSMR